MIGKINFPEDCNTDKLVEIGFNIVHSKHRGKGIMKILVAHLISKLKDDGFEWAFAKVHKDNFASSKSLQKNGFEIFESYEKPVSKIEFEQLLNQPFFSPEGKVNGKVTLEKFVGKDEIVVDYNILMLPLK